MNELIQQYLWVIITAGVGLLALILLLMAWRMFSSRMSGRRGQRLGISEYHELDKTRRLVLVRRDNTEHLVLIGGPQDVVIETGIGAGLSGQPYRPPQAEELPSLPIRPAPRPPVFGDRTPPPLRTGNGPPRPRDQEP